MTIDENLQLRVTRLLGRVLRKAPRRPQALLASAALNRVLGEQIADGDMDFMAGKALAIQVRDLDLRWLIRFDGDRLRAAPAAAASDASISATPMEFLRLLARAEDADTLFFQRRLVIEGDTDFALNVKNVLDAVDDQSLPGPLPAALTVLRRLLRGGAAEAGKPQRAGKGVAP